MHSSHQPRRGPAPIKPTTPRRSASTPKPPRAPVTPRGFQRITATPRLPRHLHPRSMPPRGIYIHVVKKLSREAPRGAFFAHGTTGQVPPFWSSGGAPERRGDLWAQESPHLSLFQFRHKTPRPWVNNGGGGGCQRNSRGIHVSSQSRGRCFTPGFSPLELATRSKAAPRRGLRFPAPRRGQVSSR